MHFLSSPPLPPPHSFAMGSLSLSCSTTTHTVFGTDFRERRKESQQTWGDRKELKLPVSGPQSCSWISAMHLSCSPGFHSSSPPFTMCISGGNMVLSTSGEVLQQPDPDYFWWWPHALGLHSSWCIQPTSALQTAAVWDFSHFPATAPMGLWQRVHHKGVQLQATPCPARKTWWRRDGNSCCPFPSLFPLPHCATDEETPACSSPSWRYYKPSGTAMPSSLHNTSLNVSAGPSSRSMSAGLAGLGGAGQERTGSKGRSAQGGSVKVWLGMWQELRRKHRVWKNREEKDCFGGE